MEGGYRYLESSACPLKDVNVFFIKVKMVLSEKVFFLIIRVRKNNKFLKHFLLKKSFCYSTTIRVTVSTF